MGSKFCIDKKLKGKRGRAGKIETEHGVIQTPAFIVVGTKATVKALTPEQVSTLGAQAVLANTYHLYLEPGEKIIKEAGGIHKFMNWNKPTFTDSGGFQAFSLGVDYDNKVGKVSQGKIETRYGERKVENTSLAGAPQATAEDLSEFSPENSRTRRENVFSTSNTTPLAKVTEDGVTFKSIIDGSTHHFTPEKSMEIQHSVGADILFAFDECTSPNASYEYQKEAMDCTHRWAKRSLDFHKENKNPYQSLFGIVQGGRHENLRRESAKIIGSMDFDGFGIGGSFDKEDLHTAVGWVADELREDRPRHLLGIGEPLDLILGIEYGMDTFDCVAPTRIARNGGLYTKNGKINILNAKYKNDFNKIEEDCACYTCINYTRAYLSHLFRAREMFAATLASIHNLYLLVHLVDSVREAILNDSFNEFKDKFIETYKN